NLTGRAVVEKIGRGEHASHGLNARRCAFNGIAVLLIRRSRLDPLHQRKVTAGRGAADSDTIRIDAVLASMETDESDRAIYILHGVCYRVTRLRTVNHRKHRVAAPAKLWGDQVMRREPAAADNQNDGR